MELTVLVAVTVLTAPVVVALQLHRSCAAVVAEPRVAAVAEL